MLTSLDGFPAFFIEPEGGQTVPPGLSRASEDAGQLSHFEFVIPGDDGSGTFDTFSESASSDDVFSLISK